MFHNSVTEFMFWAVKSVNAQTIICSSDMTWVLDWPTLLRRPLTELGFHWTLGTMSQSPETVHMGPSR